MKTSLALVPYFIENDKARLNMGLELYERLRDSPDDTLCLIGTENGFLHGILIAYLREKDAWLWQVRADSKFHKYSRIVYKTFEGWVIHKGRNKIRGEPFDKRLVRYFCSRYGYVPDGRGVMKNVRRGLFAE